MGRHDVVKNAEGLRDEKMLDKMSKIWRSF